MLVIKAARQYRQEVGSPYDLLAVPALNAQPFEVSDAHAESVLLPQGQYIKVPRWYDRLPNVCD